MGAPLPLRRRAPLPYGPGRRGARLRSTRRARGRRHAPRLRRDGTPARRARPRSHPRAGRPHQRAQVRGSLPALRRARARGRVGERRRARDCFAARRIRARAARGALPQARRVRRRRREGRAPPRDDRARRRTHALAHAPLRARRLVGRAAPRRARTLSQSDARRAARPALGTSVPALPRARNSRPRRSPTCARVNTATPA